MLIDNWFPIVGGGPINIWETSRYLIENFNNEIDLYVRALKNENGVKVTRNESYYNDKLRIFRIGPCTSFNNICGRLIWLIAVLPAILQNHRSKKYNLVHAHAFLSAIPAKIIHLLYKIPIIYTIHGTTINKKTYRLTQIIEKYLLTKIKYDQEITVARNFLKIKNINKNITFIPNGVAINKFEEIDIAKDKRFKIIWVGRFDKIKNIDLLIKAVKKLENNNITVHLIGYGNEENNIKKLVNKLNLNHIIKFKGKLTGNKLIEEYKTSHLFVLPSLSEGQPLTLLEAWAAKLPVIVTRVGENENMVIDNKNGYLIAPGNEEDLIKKIREALNNDNLKQLGITGYNLVKQNYNWKQTAKLINDIYLKFL